MPPLALSVKQPWAALLVAGVKVVEVRTWPTTRRGRILIHAGKTPDPRPEAWAWVTTAALRDAAKLVGGVVGACEIVGCVEYKTAAAFAADRGRHLNPPGWYNGGVMYGFAVRAAAAVPFVPCPGNTFFFPVDGMEQT